MRRALISHLGALALASAALALWLPATAGAARLPLASTGKVTHVRGTVVLLTGSVNPQGSPATYYFQFGATTNYGLHTAVANAGSGTKPVRVGLTAAPFLSGYHFRLVATNAAGTKLGKDRVFVPKPSRAKIELAKAETVPYGAVVFVKGRMTGLAAANHRIALQASPWPYKEAFETIGLPTVSNAAGRFVFRVGVLTRNTQFRVITLDPLPRFSKVLTVHISVRVTFKVRSSGKPGFVRLFGTVTPARLGRARVEFQLLKAVRPGRTEKTEERTSRFATVETTTLKHATRRFSFFSAVVGIRRTGVYRAFVVIRAGPLSSGGSRALTIHGGRSHVRAKR
jgi:hypothetical protein